MEECKCLYVLIRQKIVEHAGRDGKISRREVRKCLSQYRLPKDRWHEVIRELKEMKVLESDGKFKFKVIVNE